jgi:hypothetical protein
MKEFDLSRILSLLFVLVLIAALVIVINPQARARAFETVQSWRPALEQADDRVVVDIPSPGTPGPTSTPFPTLTPVDDKQIPVTGDQDASNEPIIQVNWDALGDGLRQFWVKLSEIRIEFNSNPAKDNK